MSSKQWKTWTNVVVKTLLANALVLSQSALAGQNQNNKATTQSAQKTASQQPAATQASGEVASKTPAGKRHGEIFEHASGNGPQEGIKVHGHWTIEVSNPDGRVVSHREFENGLVPGTFLNSILARTQTVGFWTIYLNALACTYSYPNPNYPLININEPGYCYLNEFSISLPPSFQPAGGVVTSSISGNNFVLNGLMTATYSGLITVVSTFNLPYPPTCSPSSIAAENCGGQPLFQFPTAFTSTTLATPIQVSAGQTVAVTVNISFS
jgi:hypothetical protein